MSSQASNSATDGIATWGTKPATGQWNTAANWSPAEVPSNAAIFGTSIQTAISFVQDEIATVGEIEFLKGASAYFFNFDFPVLKNSPALTIAGRGVVNKSGSHQCFVVASTAVGYDYPQLMFTNKASAGGSSMYYSAGPASLEGSGGGVIRFVKESTAGSANFNVTTGAGTPPRDNSTVGGEVSFGDNSSAESAVFTISGSTSLTDGDTFGNTVFHNCATAANAKFTNTGGTVPGGDGGNTQFYDTSTAANGVFNNLGGTAYGALYTTEDGKTVQKQQGSNGGDVAFDGSATGGNGQFHNFAAMVAGANGGVTSFNNNPPNVTPFTLPGANAGYGSYTNYGANGANVGGGGHTYFTSKHGSASAANGTFNNNGSSVEKSSSAGHTVFSITEGTDGTSVSYGDAKPSGKSGSVYYPTAGDATFWNHPATTEDGAPGYTEFAVYQPYNDDGSRDSSSGKSDSGGANSDNVPTAGNGIFHNLSGKVSGAAGGVTKFQNTSRAGSATLIAYGGDGGEPGQIEFSDTSLGEQANVQLHGGGLLSLGYHTGGLTLGSLKVCDAGTIKIQVGSSTTDVAVSGKLDLDSAVLTFSIYDAEGFAPDTPYTILSAENLSDYSTDQFRGNSVNGMQPTFKIEDDKLLVSFGE
jgi:hypothetical protein